MKLKSLLTLAAASLCSWPTAWADDVVANVTLKEKNSLSSEILALADIDDVKSVTHLTVTTQDGVQLGSEDWTTLQSMAALVELDLSQASADAVPKSQFNGCCANLVTVKLPKDLTTIGAYSFENKSNLVTVVVPSTVTTIGNEAFGYCYCLEDCDISACQLEAIPAGCFFECNSLNSFTIPSTVTVIYDYAFYRCRSFTSPLPAGLTGIGGSAFYEAAMTDIDVVIPEGMAVNYRAFTWSGIRSIELPSTYAYYIPAFEVCNNLQTVTLKSPTVVTGNGFDHFLPLSNASDVTLKVPSHLVAAYKSNPVWSQYKDVVAISPAVTDYTVSNNLNLSSSSMRMEGTPNVYFTENASLTVAGNAAQVFGNFTASTNLRNGDYWGGTMILNESADVTATGFSQRIYMSRYTWNFLCLPFDFTVGDITAESGVFVVRTYDGARRNSENVSSGNWSGNLSGDVEIKAGTGFILQTSEDTWVTIKAKADGTNYSFSKESDEVKLALAANNSNSEATAANTGWNMVGNPYLAYYNIHKLNYTAPFAVYNRSYYRYDTYSPADDDYALSPLQALFVQCPGGVESIDFPAEGRQMTSEITSQNGARRSSASSRQLLDIQVSDGSLSDKTRLVVNAGASATYEIGRDASKFFDGGSPTPQIYSLDADGTQYAINERPADSGTLRLGILFAEDGEYTLSALRNALGQVVLTDHETGIRTDLSQHGYTFDAEAGSCESRFTISFGGAATGIETLDNLTISPSDNCLHDLSGRRLANGQIQRGLYIVNGKKVIVNN